MGIRLTFYDTLVTIAILSLVMVTCISVSVSFLIRVGFCRRALSHDNFMFCGSYLDLLLHETELEEEFL